MTAQHDFGGVWDSLWTLSCGLSQFHDHGSWIVCEVALTLHIQGELGKFAILKRYPTTHVMYDA